MKRESYALYPHQVTGVEFLTRRGRAVAPIALHRYLSATFSCILVCAFSSA
jgi:hypothetical protein